MKEEIVIPITGKDGKDYASKKYSVTIEDLAEGYKHKYKTYFFITDKNGQFVSPVKNYQKGKHLIHCCDSTWKLNKYTENESLLNDRTQNNRFQFSGTHKPLNFLTRIKETETEYYLKEQRRISKNIREEEQRKFERKIRKQLQNGEDLGELSYEKEEVIQQVAIENRQRKLLENIL